MACDTFLKIVQKCKRKFVIVQVTSIFALALCLWVVIAMHQKFIDKLLLWFSGWRKWAVCIWTSSRPTNNCCWSWATSDSYILWICMHLYVLRTNILTLQMCEVCDLCFCFFFTRLAIWFKQNLIHRREMNTCRGWWIFLTRFVWDPPPPPQFCERNLHRIKIAQGIILYRKKGLKVFLYFHNVTNNDGPYIYINEPLTKIWKFLVQLQSNFFSCVYLVWLQFFSI
jgi:hypothetical protein